MARQTNEQRFEYYAEMIEVSGKLLLRADRTSAEAMAEAAEKFYYIERLAANARAVAAKLAARNQKAGRA